MKTSLTNGDESGKAAAGAVSDGPKYKQIYTALRVAISEGTYSLGTKLPSENVLVDRFAASRPTIGRALAQLESEGLVQRRAGSGTFVTRKESEKHLVFGLLIPELGLTEIFEPICQGISQAHPDGQHDLIWGPLFQRNGPSEIQAERLCEYYLNRNLSGVFFAPLELSMGKDAVNMRIVRSFDEANIPVVLLDRDICDYPQRSRYDLVGIDNHRAGRVITDHVLDRGARRPVFFTQPYSAPTVLQRYMGFCEALLDRPAIEVRPVRIMGDPGDLATVERLLAEHSPDAIVCANDYTAAQLMTNLDKLSIQVPSEIKVTGMDDVKYASLLKVSLTTIHQPCASIGYTALMAMQDRVAHLQMPPRDFVVDFTLVVRKSSG